jgi:hypothetical protein
LVNDIFDGGRYAQFGTAIWEHDLAGGLRMPLATVAPGRMAAASGLPHPQACQPA